MSVKTRDLGMTPLDDLFSTDESRAESQLEKVVTLNPAEISDFPNHPFKVKQDEAMAEMVDSIRKYGVLVPSLVRPKEDGGYEMVAGHRRKFAAALAELTEIPCIVRNLTDDEATIIMVDSNLQRETILPSEKAFAYKMKLDAMKRQGQRSDLTCAPMEHNLCRPKPVHTPSKDLPHGLGRFLIHNPAVFALRIFQIPVGRIGGQWCAGHSFALEHIAYLLAGVLSVPLVEQVLHRNKVTDSLGGVDVVHNGNIANTEAVEAFFQQLTDDQAITPQAGMISLCQLNTKFFTDAGGGCWPFF